MLSSRLAERRATPRENPQAISSDGQRVIDLAAQRDEIFAEMKALQDQAGVILGRPEGATNLDTIINIMALLQDIATQLQPLEDLYSQIDGAIQGLGGRLTEEDYANDQVANSF